MTANIIDSVRDDSAKNYYTPVIALTGFDNKAEEKFRDLNSSDITVLTYDGPDGRWRDIIKNKVLASIPSKRYEFVILCALDKEANAYEGAGYQVGERKIIKGLACREIKIDEKIGVIVTAPRMGLVSAAITCANSINLFQPRLVCMSGISAGVHDKAKIYDVVIPDICFQNDSGKWKRGRFELEAYPVQIEHNLKLRIENSIAHSHFKNKISEGISLKKSEIPDGVEELDFNIYCAPASSGSSVVADKTVAVELIGQHRKLSAFEMESYAIYEAARLSNLTPLFFSAKSVVDIGTETKNDDFHRVACLLSAKVVYQLIASGVATSQ